MLAAAAATFNFDFERADKWRRNQMPGKEVNMAKRGRDAGSGKFIPVKEAVRRKATAIVEPVKKSPPKKGK